MGEHQYFVQRQEPLKAFQSGPGCGPQSHSKSEAGPGLELSVSCMGLCFIYCLRDLFLFIYLVASSLGCSAWELLLQRADSPVSASSVAVFRLQRPGFLLLKGG